MRAAIDSSALLPRLRLMRLPNAVTAAADVLAGGALAGVSPGRLAPLLIAAPLLYAGGCVLNDLRDRDRDIDLHPQRPLPSGAVSPKEAALIASALFAAALLAAAGAGVRPAAAAAGVLALILLYDLHAKSRPVAGPAAMGACRGGAVLLGMSPAFPSSGYALFFPLATFLYVFALSRLARRETSDLSDPPGAVTFAPLLAAAASLLAGAALFPGFTLWPAALFLALLLLPVATGLAKGLKPQRSGDVAKGVTALILGIPLLEAFVAAGAGSFSMGMAAAVCALPAAVGRRVFYVT